MENSKFNGFGKKISGKFTELKKTGSEKFSKLKEKNSEESRTIENEDSYLNSPSMKFFEEPKTYEPAGLNVPKEELYALKDPYGSKKRFDDRDENAEPLKKVKKKRRKKHPLLRVLIVIVIIAGLYLHLSSDLFNVQSITVTGNSSFSKKQIVKMTDFEVGKNIFISRLGKSADNIKKDPYFEKVSIRRDLPSSIVIEVKERQAIGAVARHGKTSDYVIIDRKGVVLEDNSKDKKDRKGKTLTQLTGLKIKEAVLGEELQVTDENRKTQALKLLKGKTDSKLSLSKIEVGESETVLYINDSFYAKGAYKNVLPITEDGSLKKVVKTLKKSGYSKGTIMVGNNGYVAFSNKLK